VPPDEYSEPASPDSFLALRKTLEQDPDRWFAMRDGPPPSINASPPRQPLILKSGSRDAMIP
jgi:hypothetical protein